MKYFRISIQVLRGCYLGIRLLLRPEDLQTLIKLGTLLTDLPAYAAALAQLKTDAEIRTLIENRYSPGMPTMEELKTYPVGTLGKAYYDQLFKYNLSPYVALPTANQNENVYLRERSREIHDIIHTVLNLGITVEEEAQVNAFFMVKGATPFTTMIVVGAFLHFLFKRPAELSNLIKRVNVSWSMGSRMKSPFAIRWEEFMDKPIIEVKKEMGFTATELAVQQVPMLVKDPLSSLKGSDMDQYL